MDAIVYYVILQDEEKDLKRSRQLELFLKENSFDVVQTYYDVYTEDFINRRLGLRLMLKDLRTRKIKADAFLCLAITDMVNRKNLIDCISEINFFVPSIYFISIETSNHDDIA